MIPIVTCLARSQTDVTDTAGGESGASAAYIKEVIMPIMDAFPEAETCVEVRRSATRPSLSDVAF